MAQVELRGLALDHHLLRPRTALLLVEVRQRQVADTAPAKDERLTADEDTDAVAAATAAAADIDDKARRRLHHCCKDAPASRMTSLQAAAVNNPI